MFNCDLYIFSEHLLFLISLPNSVLKHPNPAMVCYDFNAIHITSIISFENLEYKILHHISIKARIPERDKSAEELLILGLNSNSKC